VSSESWHVGWYGGLPLSEHWFGDFSAFYGEASSVVKRTQQLPDGTVSSRAKVYGQEWMVQAGLGAQLAPQGSQWSLVPTARVAYAGSHQNGSREEGAGAFGVLTKSQLHGTVLSKVALEGAREWRVGGIPFRGSGNVEWLHDFAVDPRRMGLRWAGEPNSPWSVGSSRGRADALKVGLALEMRLTPEKTIRVYGEREFLRRTSTTQMGVNFSIGF
jgi:outer membrane autotransporter protein